MFRQHGYGAVNEVDACGTLLSLTVYDRALGDIVRHIGNVDTHLIQVVAMLPYAQCIVEVFSILRVNGKRGDTAEVFAACYLLLGYVSRELVGSLFYLLRIFVRQVILSQYGMHLNIVVALLSKHIDNLTHKTLAAKNRVILALGVGGRPLGNLDHSLLTCLSALQLLLRNKNVVIEHITLGNKECIVLLHL